MVLKGLVKNNTIILTPPVNLPDGTVVDVIPLDNNDNNIDDPICGSWQDDRSAEEIIKDIRNSRHSRDKKITL